MLTPVSIARSGFIASGAVGWPHVASGHFRSGGAGDAAVVSGSIGSGQVGLVHLASGAIVPGSISGGGVGSGMIASGAVQGFFGTTRHIASGTVGGFDFGSGAVIAGSVGSGAVLSGSIASGQIGVNHLASGAVRSGVIASGQIGLNHLASGAVRSGVIASGQIGLNHLASGAVLSGSIASGQVGQNHIASGAVTSGRLGVTGTPTGAGLLQDDFSWVTPDWEFIGTVTANNTASIDFIGLSASYSAYMIVWSNVVPASGGTSLYLRTSANSGVSYDAASGNYNWCELSINVSGSTGTAGSTDSFLRLVSNVGNTGAQQTQGHVIVYNPNVVDNCSVTSVNGTVTNTGVYSARLVGGRRLAAGLVNAIRLLMSGGNIASGYFWLYGLKAS